MHKQTHMLESQPDNKLHCVSKKVHPYDVHDNYAKWKPI